MEPLIDGSWDASDFDGDIRASPVCQLVNAVTPRLDRVVLCQVDRVVGVELSGLPDPFDDPIDNDCLRSELGCHRYRVQFQSASALITTVSSIVSWTSSRP